jgi:hypothetical protein
MRAQSVAAVGAYSVDELRMADYLQQRERIVLAAATAEQQQQQQPQQPPQQPQQQPQQPPPPAVDIVCGVCAGPESESLPPSGSGGGSLPNSATGDAIDAAIDAAIDEHFGVVRDGAAAAALDGWMMPGRGYGVEGFDQPRACIF